MIGATIRRVVVNSPMAPVLESQGRRGRVRDLDLRR